MKNGTPLAAAALAVLLAASPATAEEIVRIETRPGVTVQFAVKEPASPKGGVILFAGGDGRLKLGRGLAFLNKSGNFTIRTRHRFFHADYIVVSVDVPSDRKDMHEFRPTADHAADIGAVIAWLRQKTKDPVWLIGHSRGSLSAANGAARLGPTPGGPDGIVLMSPVTQNSNDAKPTVYDVPLKDIRQPAVVVQHRDDACYVTPLYGARSLAEKISATILEFQGGKDPVSRPCQAKSQHGFFGIEKQTVRKTVAEMRRLSPN